MTKDSQFISAKKLAVKLEKNGGRATPLIGISYPHSNCHNNQTPGLTIEPYSDLYTLFGVCGLKPPDCKEKIPLGNDFVTQKENF
jgi:hypothetical protein